MGLGVNHHPVNSSLTSVTHLMQYFFLRAVMLQNTRESSQTNVRKGHHANLQSLENGSQLEFFFFFGSKVILL